MGFFGSLGKGVLAGVSGIAKGAAGAKLNQPPKTTSHDPGGTWGQTTGMPGFLKRRPKPKSGTLISRTPRPTISNSRGMKGGAMTLTGKR